LSGYWCGQGPLYISSAACAQEDGTFSFASQLSNGIPWAAYIGANDTVFYTNLSAFRLRELHNDGDYGSGC
jgi:hypothetical protein